MGIRSWWRDIQSPTAEGRDNLPLSFNQWLETFTFDGTKYGVGKAQSLHGLEEKIGADFRSLAAGAYGANGVVFACMAARQTLFSQARFLWRRFEDGRPGEMFATPDGRQTGSSDLRLLNTPWPGGTTGDLLARMIQDADLAGDSFVARGLGGLIRLRPDWVTIVYGNRGRDDGNMWDLDAELVGYLYQPGGPGSTSEVTSLRPEEVAHFSPYPDPVSPGRGMSWLTPLVREIQGDSAATVHKNQMYENGATVNLVLNYDPSVDLELFEAAKRSFAEGHEGAANAYKTLHLLGATAQTIGADMQQMDFKALQGSAETRIAAASGIHPVVVALSEGLEGSSLNAGNFGAARRITGDKTLRYLWQNACGSLANIVTVPANSELWYDDQDIPFLREDEKDRAQIENVKATTIKLLVETGFEPKSVVEAVDSQDIGRLKHTNLVSVQLRKPGETEPTPPKPEGEAEGNGKVPPELLDAGGKV